MSNQLQVSGEAKIRAIQGPVVANSGVITALDGDASEYVRGDGTLADFPTSTGGGSSVSYYLNTSVSQGTIGGVAYKQLSKTPISGAGTNVTTSANGYIASYITDANDPALLEVPAGNFNCEFYFSVNSNAHNPYVYAELYKYDGTTFTLLGSNVAIPQYLTNGTTLSAYYFAIPVATSVLTVTDRISIRIYVNVDGRTVTLHTENNHLCQVVTTFSKGLISLNNLTRQNQFFATGTSGTDFNISSATATHTFNIPDASATNRGLITTGSQTIAGIKSFNNAIKGEEGILLKNGVISSSTGYTALNGFDDTLIITSLISGTSYSNYLEFTPSTTNTYTFPNLSGTLALLEGTQTFTGVKTFDEGISLKSAAFPTPATGYSSIGGNSFGITIITKQSSTIYTSNLGFPAANRTFTFPNADGTLALTSNLSSYVPYTGATTSVNLGGFGLTASAINVGNIVSDGNIILKKVGLSVSTPLYVTQFAATTGVGIGYSDGTGGGNFAFPTAAIYTYTFPASTGTIALTSDLSGYVTLATTQTISGSKTFSSSPIIDNGTSGIPLRFKQYASTNFGLAGYTDIIPVGATLIAFAFGQTGADTKIAYFSAASLTNNVSQEYTLPNATGTLALLSGTQTFTGATTFSSNITVNSVQVGNAGNGSNVKLGGSTLGAITTGSNNIAIGTSALTSLTTSNANIGIGNSALASVVDGAFNTAIGFGIGGSITSGSNNALFGYGAGSSITTGNYNTIIGAYAGTAGMSNNIVLADGAGTIRYQWNGTNNAFTGAATFSSSVGVGAATNVNGTLEVWGSGASVAQFSIGRSASIHTDFFIDATGNTYIQPLGVTKVTLLTSGNVGIGVTSTVGKLDISTGGNRDVVISNDSTDTGYNIVSLNGSRTKGSYAGLAGGGTGDNNLYLNSGVGVIIQTGASFTERMRITSGGNVLIGTTTDNGYKLTVSGQSIFTNSVSSVVMQRTGGDGQILTFYKDGTLVGSISTNTNSLPSDLNFKKNISNLELGLNLVTKLRAVSYNHKIDNEDAALSTGFIAQELEKSLEELGVDKNAYYILQNKPNKDETQSQYWIDYTKMIPILVNAIQEQQAQIQNLQEQNQDLKSRLDKAGL